MQQTLNLDLTFNIVTETVPLLTSGFPEGEYTVVGHLIDDSGNEELSVQAALKVIGR